ncbi:MAG: type II toxin-antitoxin system CcdA family antitoxin [Rhodoferax sp.]|nr:type II toxin-antitoxin system CcdA family antitoxin [Rhodoferax sp.]
MSRAVTAAKKPVNLRIRADLLRQAKELQINVSQVLEAALVNQLKRLRQEQWLADNQEAIELYNRQVEVNGLFTEGLRKRTWTALGTPVEAPTTERAQQESVA